MTSKAQLEISTMSSMDYAELTETPVGSGVYTDGNYTVWIQEVWGYPPTQPASSSPTA